MRKSLIAAFAAALFIAVTGSALADETPAPKPIVVKDKVTVKAVVESIDRASRTLTLKGPKGEPLTLVVDESVTRFDNMKVGDTVNAQYFESVAYDIKRPGAPVPPDTVTDSGGKFSGEKPGGALMTKTVTTVTIQAIDLATPAVTVKSSDGQISNHRVRERKNLIGVKVGDQVTVTQTAALMIAVEAAK